MQTAIFIGQSLGVSTSLVGVFALLLSACSADGGTAANGSPADNLTGLGEGSSQVCTDEAFECEVFDLANAVRVQAGLAPLTYNVNLSSAAAAHARDMSHRGYFSHDSLDGRDFSERVAETPYVGFATGENIAKGQRDPASVMNSWMDSDGHRRNILSDRSNEIGVGVADNHWVQVFGRATRAP